MEPNKQVHVGCKVTNSNVWFDLRICQTEPCLSCQVLIYITIHVTVCSAQDWENLYSGILRALAFNK